MKLNLIETKEITDFEKEIGVELVVTERATDSDKYSVSFKGSEVMSEGCLIGKSGDGNSIDKAIRDYCQKVSSCRIAFGAYTENRKEIKLPKLIHTKLLNL